MPITSMKRYEIEAEEKWREDILPKIPYLPFKAEWEVAVIPPYSGAVARFFVRLKGNDKTRVSIYLDWFEKIGYHGGTPYWEVYPCEGDCNRHDLDDVTGLMTSIQQSLDEQIKDQP